MELQKIMLRISLIAIIALLVGLLVLALLIRLGRRTAEGSVLIVWHVISAAIGLIVFLGAALLLEVAARDSRERITSRLASRAGRLSLGTNKSQFSIMHGRLQL